MAEPQLSYAPNNEKLHSNDPSSAALQQQQQQQQQHQAAAAAADDRLLSHDELRRQHGDVTRVQNVTVANVNNASVSNARLTALSYCHDYYGKLPLRRCDKALGS